MAILDTLARNKSLQQSAKRITNGNDLWHDLFQHSILKLYDLGEERVIGLNEEGNISGYMAVIMHRDWHDKSSKFNKLHRPEWESLTTDLIYSDDDGNPVTASGADVEICKEYFDTVTPDRIIVARAMEKMKTEDNDGKHFHYRTALLEHYIELGGISQVSRFTGIDRVTVRKDLNSIYEQIKKNGEGTTH